MCPFWPGPDKIERASWLSKAYGAGRRRAFEKDWSPTVPGKNWFAYLRFYELTEAYFDRSWPLPDFQQV